MERMEKIQAYIQAHREQIIQDVIALVEHQSPTANVEYAEKCADFLVALVKERLGIEPEQVFPQETRGRHLFFRIGSGRPKAILIGHYDTVWDVDALPLVRDGNKLCGPGAFDMKYGIISGIWGLKALMETGGIDYCVGFFMNSDEETGSRTSRACYEPIAKTFEHALILEPLMQNNFKTSRKGIGNFTVEITGKAAHAGNDFLKGRSAILEAARLTEKLFALTDLEQGSSVNVGVISGGTKPNVVAAHATLQVDLRVTKASEAERMTKAIYDLKPSLDGVTVKITGGMNRPPFEENETTQALFQKVKALAAQMGIEISCGTSGGGSDGNFTYSWGIPTLDSLGGVGDGAHAAWEHILLDESLQSTVLFATFLDTL